MQRVLNRHCVSALGEALAHQAGGQPLRQVQPLQLHCLWHAQPAELQAGQAAGRADSGWGRAGRDRQSARKRETKQAHRRCLALLLAAALLQRSGILRSLYLGSCQPWQHSGMPASPPTFFIARNMSADREQAQAAMTTTPSACTPSW